MSNNKSADIIKKKVLCIGNTTQLPEFVRHSDWFEVVGIICEKGREQDLFNYSLIKGIPLIIVSKSSEIISKIKTESIDIAIMFSFGKILRKEFLDEISTFNIHFSILPDNKGRHPTFWSIRNDDNELGVSLHKVTPGIDEGEIICQRKIKNYFWKTEEDFAKELTDHLPDLINELGEFLKYGGDTIPNVEGKYNSAVQENLITIDLESHTPNEIFNICRAQHRYNGARIEIKNENIILWVKKIKFVPLVSESPNLFFSLNGLDYIKYTKCICIELIDYKKEII
jgi:methionyl-tRNA formyltransferase